MKRNLIFSTLAAGLLIAGYARAVSEKYPEQQSFTFAQLCDTQLGMGGYKADVGRFKQAVKQINALKPDFAVICGDLVQNADDSSYADFKQIRNSLIIPCYCAAGNHDVLNQPTAESLKYYREQVGKDYYSFEHKGYTFVVVNTQLWKAPLKGESEKHHQWVVETLHKAKEKKSPVFIVAHFPLYLKQLDEAEEYFNLPVAVRTQLLALYKECGVVAVLAGHTHKTIISSYEGILLVNGETTSKNFDNRPFGFRRWQVDSPASIQHTFVALDTESAEREAP